MTSGLAAGSVTCARLNQKQTALSMQPSPFYTILAYETVLTMSCRALTVR